MGGINIVATYVLWNHHEEIKGVYDWQNSKDLRRFLLLCKKHELDVIIRIGPWDHGEVRNGGFPDWLYSEPLVVRSNDPLYLKYVNKLFEEIGKQCHGLFYKDCGPIIGIQLENEYQHAGAVWEMTTGTSNEWIMSGEEGNEHIKELKKISESHEMVAPIYTGTGWGGAVADVDTVLPLWGDMHFGLGFSLMKRLQNIQLHQNISTVTIESQHTILILHMKRMMYLMQHVKWVEVCQSSIVIDSNCLIRVLMR